MMFADVLSSSTLSGASRLSTGGVVVVGGTDGMFPMGLSFAAIASVELLAALALRSCKKFECLTHI